MQASRPSIRTLTRPELDIGIDWAATERWNAGLHDGSDAASHDAASGIGLRCERVRGTRTGAPAKAR